MQWVREPRRAYRAELDFDPNKGTVKEAFAHVADAIKWCRANKMMVWNDTSLTIRFTSEKNLSWFLLRWS